MPEGAVVVHKQEHQNECCSRNINEIDQYNNVCYGAFCVNSEVRISESQIQERVEIFIRKQQA